ncbi:HAD-IIB family hydrolase [Ectothiorhodospiraceae bacterium BW-2]|nr:HAD-IIB family hydrolase [Ectothiorhodospiraceae bacterium BW-2]
MTLKLLATDLDRTLLPNGRWPADEGAIEQFNQLTCRHDLRLVYVTGRNLALTESAIAEYGIRYPDTLCGDVGTTIYHYHDGHWHEDSRWHSIIEQRSPRWSATDIAAQLSSLSELEPQPSEQCHRFKQSYYLPPTGREALVQQLRQRLSDRFDAVLIDSFDPVNDLALLDIQPASATKESALRFVATHYGVANQQVVYCGDSGNDLHPLSAGFCGVVVRNGDAQLRQALKQVQQEQPKLQLYFACGNYGAGSGYYTSGVIEGARHYRLI